MKQTYAGTILPTTRYAPHDDKSGNPRPLVISMINAKTKPCHCIDSPLEKITNALSTVDSDVLLAPEWFFVKNSKNTMYDKKEYHGILEKLEKISQKHDTLLIPGTVAWAHGGYHMNTVPIVYKGQILHECSKRNDGGDSEFAARYDLEWKPGIATNVFSWRDFSVAIQICLDHIKDMPDSEVDLQLVVSAGMSLYQNRLNKLRANGIAACCDGMKGLNEIKQTKTTCDPIDIPTIDIPPTRKITLYDTTMSVFDVSL
ncbi:hypothetical protein COT47_06240 [Candidatus Woesearchaeota archaeon CG08_land_8_20_14_0_20_43_7]|nr:MAG: hypothetical protein COT47_06240 [Candidatus Woesearchaeota archaeon CG08_land_8_20_14_0_20_43_7]